MHSSPGWNLCKVQFRPGASVFARRGWQAGNVKAVPEPRGWARRWSVWWAHLWRDGALSDRYSVQSRLIFLRRGQAVSLPRSQAETRIEVERGVVWLTVSPSDGDHLLAAGQARSVSPRDGRVVVEGIGEAAIRVVG